MRQANCPLCGKLLTLIERHGAKRIPDHGENKSQAYLCPGSGRIIEQPPPRPASGGSIHERMDQDNG